MKPFTRFCSPTLSEAARLLCPGNRPGSTACLSFRCCLSVASALVLLHPFPQHSEHHWADQKPNNKDGEPAAQLEVNPRPEVSVRKVSQLTVLLIKRNHPKHKNTPRASKLPKRKETIIRRKAGKKGKKKNGNRKCWRWWPSPDPPVTKRTGWLTSSSPSKFPGLETSNQRLKARPGFLQTF